MLWWVGCWCGVELVVVGVGCVIWYDYWVLMFWLLLICCSSVL